MSDLQFEYLVYVRWLCEGTIAQIERDLDALARKGWRIIGTSVINDNDITYTLERVVKQGRDKGD